MCGVLTGVYREPLEKPHLAWATANHVCELIDKAGGAPPMANHGSRSTEQHAPSNAATASGDDPGFWHSCIRLYRPCPSRRRVGAAQKTQINSCARTKCPA